MPRTSPIRPRPIARLVATLAELLLGPIDRATDLGADQRARRIAAAVRIGDVVGLRPRDRQRLSAAPKHRQRDR